MNLLAIDFGTKRMGFALGNTAINSAAPLDPFDYKNPNQVFDHINRLVDDYDITRVLIGYPLNMDGTKSTTTEEVERFAGKLKKNLAPGIAVDFVDERLSSFEAEETLKSLHPDFKKRKKFLDSVSALLILRRFMEEK